MKKKVKDPYEVIAEWVPPVLVDPSIVATRIPHAAVTYDGRGILAVKATYDAADHGDALRQHEQAIAEGGLPQPTAAASCRTDSDEALADARQALAL